MPDDFYTYKGTCPVGIGDTVCWIDRDDEVPYKAEVMECLASQFIAAIDTGKVVHHRYVFYRDKGWLWHEWNKEWEAKVEAAKAARDTAEGKQAQGQDQVQQEGEAS